MYVHNQKKWLFSDFPFKGTGQGKRIVLPLRGLIRFMMAQPDFRDTSKHNMKTGLPKLCLLIFKHTLFVYWYLCILINDA